MQCAAAARQHAPSTASRSTCYGFEGDVEPEPAPIDPLLLEPDPLAPLPGMPIEPDEPLVPAPVVELVPPFMFPLPIPVPVPVVPDPLMEDDPGAVVDELLLEPVVPDAPVPPVVPPAPLAPLAPAPPAAACAQLPVVESPSKIPTQSVRMIVFIGQPRTALRYFHRAEG